jgi:carboxymethylenebutenolidase
MTDGALSAATETITGHGGDRIDGYYARPSGDGEFPGVVVIQHIFGVDEWIMEVCRKLAHHGYAALAPNLYARIGSLGSGSPDDLAARLRSRGGLDDDTVIGDLQAAVEYIRAQAEASGKVGAIGFCMGGRFAYLAACRLPSLDAAVDCWGGGVAPDPAQPGAPRVIAVDETASMSAPLLGIFGNDDLRPDPAEVDRTEARLRELGKTYEFHRYDGAGHGFFNWAAASYRRDQAMDGWSRVFTFFEKYIASPAAVARA